MGSDDTTGKKQTVAAKLEPETVEWLDSMVDGEHVTTRSQAMREAINNGRNAESGMRNFALQTARLAVLFGALGLGNSVFNLVSLELRAPLYSFSIFVLGIIGVYLFAWVRT
jgi:hypothetical protein